MQDSPNRAAIKKEKGGGGTLVLCFSNSCHFDCLLAVSLDNLLATETNPIGRSAPVRSKREMRAFREFEGELWDGWRKSGGEKMFLSSLGASGEEEVLCGTSKSQQTNKEVDLFYYLLKAAWSYAIIQLRQSRAPRGLGCKGHVRNSAARFLRIFPPAPCFFLMASGVHWKGRREGKKL